VPQRHYDIDDPSRNGKCRSFDNSVDESDVTTLIEDLIADASADFIGDQTSCSTILNNACDHHVHCCRGLECDNLERNGKCRYVGNSVDESDVTTSLIKDLNSCSTSSCRGRNDPPCCEGTVCRPIGDGGALCMPLFADAIGLRGAAIANQG
jgi:hypothetical protein